MPSASDQPWASGPTEILQHAIDLLKDDSDINRRLALILTDNAVEQMIKTFLGLPRRITGLQIPRKRLQEVAESFPTLLDTLEEHASDKLAGIDLGIIEWYHRIRNELYHQGYGLTVERQKAEVYAEIANTLLNNLFGVSLSEQLGEEVGILGGFTMKWAQLETTLWHAARKHGYERSHGLGVSGYVQALLAAKSISAPDVRLISRIRMLRNEIVHGQTDYRTVVNSVLMSELEGLIDRVASMC